MEKIDKTIKKESIEQLQLIEQTLQNLILQKQMFNVELLEINNALNELNNVKEDEVYKIVGTIMIKTTREDVEKELKRKAKLMELRIKEIENQEKAAEEKLLKLRSAILSNQSKVEKK